MTLTYGSFLLVVANYLFKCFLVTVNTFNVFDAPTVSIKSP